MHIVSSNTHDISHNEIHLDYHHQDTAEICFLSSADSEISLLSKALGYFDVYPSLRLTNILKLEDKELIDEYISKTLKDTKIIIARILGGKNYWSYGIDKIVESHYKKGNDIIFFPGDDKFDEQLYALSTIKGKRYRELWAYFIEGGPINARNALEYIKYIKFNSPKPDIANKLNSLGIYWPNNYDLNAIEIERCWAQKNREIIGITFYSALLQSGQTGIIDELIKELNNKNYNCLPIYSKSFKDKTNSNLARYLFKKYSPKSIINLTGFSLMDSAGKELSTIFDNKERPVFQGILSSMSEHDWKHSTKGLNNRDIIMNVSLPELDGRIITKTIAFKEKIGFDSKTQIDLYEFKPHIAGVKYISNLVDRWNLLSKLKNNNKKVFISLANYPNKDSRIGNGVGLDTPESIIRFAKKMSSGGYLIGNFPDKSDIFMQILLSGQTNSKKKKNSSNNQRMSLKDYSTYYNEIPLKLRNDIEKQWGKPIDDPFVSNKEFVLPIHQFKNLAIGIQPARGYNIDPKNTYHSPDLVPPHNYFAYYFWISQKFNANALIQFGKHGNLEWLPGKALSLSEECYPEAILKSMPLIYPFIVNDPGEGTQAKRRNAAVIIDHLTPALTKADSYGELISIEHLLDEYYDSYQTDEKRADIIKEQIIDQTKSIGLYEDSQVDVIDNIETKLNKIDTYLCDLKELQIRDGLHIFGRSPPKKQLNNLLLSISKIPRGNGLAENQSILEAISKDLKLNFDPNNCELSEKYNGLKKKFLLNLTKDKWRTNADTIERLEILSEKIIERKFIVPDSWVNTTLVAKQMNNQIKSRIKTSGQNELNGILRALDGKFVTPGPSGAPTRGKIEVIPTGKNFFSIDMRSLPTKTAWLIGKNSADLLISDFYNRKGHFPSHFGLSAWGTSNMRTGGDDISQALALIGVMPKWSNSSGRVNGFEIIPLSKLGRPRIDVTLRISGFFRDAFPNLINLFDEAIKAIIEQKEELDQNPIKASYLEDLKVLQKGELDDSYANRLASYRVFSSMPGSYGAGLQSMIDEGVWSNSDDLAQNYIDWSSFAYGSDNYGDQNANIFSQKLERIEAVIHNQDNREHDILDSDDYYQFHGGMGAAVKKISGKKPLYYHNDNSNPNNLKVRTLDEEISRIVRGRAGNPKWIESIMRHGYKGAFELLATLDYLYAYQATTGLVKDHHFDLLFESYIIDESVRQFIEKFNPDALDDMKKRFLDSIDRKLWHPKRNDTMQFLKLNKGQ